MEISLVSPDHPDEDIWEEYVFGRLTDAKGADLEEHLLVCGRCQTVLAEIDEYVRLMKHEMARRAQAPPVGPSVPVPLPIPAVQPVQPAAACGHQPWHMAIQVAAGILAMAAAFAAVGFVRNSALPDSVPLVSRRGPAVTEVRAGHPLDFSISAADVPSSPQYTLEVVNSTGGPVWGGQASIGGGKLSAHMDKILSAGQYWVRLSGQGPELLAEYGLRAK